jgi:hypothetical protein
MERLYLDTNVLFPMTLMDLLLAMAEDFSPFATMPA